MVDDSRSQADALVVIRYPAIVDNDAAGAYYRAFASNAIGGDFQLKPHQANESDRIAQSIIAKSNYLTMSLYRELQSQLPAHSVLLSPHLITLDDEGILSSRPLLASEEIPSVITIDFNVYSFPDPTRMMDSPPLTFGDIVTPMFVVHSNRWLRPSTHGLLLSSADFMVSAWDQSEEQADQQFRSRLNHDFGAYDRPLDFITFLGHGVGRLPDLPRKSIGPSRREVIAVEEYPIEKIRMDGDVVSRLARDDSIDPFAEDFVKGASTRVVRALNRVDHDRATFFQRQRALARFDTDLAIAFLARSEDERALTRMLMGETLISAEKRFLSVQSERLYQGTFEGDYGKQMRQMIAAEYRLLEERRELARAQNLSTALAIVAMAGAVYASSSGSSNGNYLPARTMSNIMMLSSLWAMNSAMDANAKSKTLGQNFLVQMAPAINQQVSIQLEWLESKREITANGFEEFREKTLALYQKSIRSIDHPVDRQCQFRHPDLEISGTWYGGCLNGLATASGYGLIADDLGNSVEFVGAAEYGLPSGTGAMIVRFHRDVGAVYYEGGFSDGLPDGVVLVEQPGKVPRVRTFRNGKDSGRADADDLERLQF
jgi:hypothetical protein